MRFIVARLYSIETSACLGPCLRLVSCSRKTEADGRDFDHTVMVLDRLLSKSLPDGLPGYGRLFTAELRGVAGDLVRCWVGLAHENAVSS